MNNENLISIIIPVYNSSKYLQDTIESIEKQTYKNYEAIFIDDMSNDNSVKIIKKYMSKNARIKIIQLKKHIGAPRARNIGIRKARGRYLTFLDSDDILVENKLELQINFMKKNNYEFIYGSFKYINDKANKVSSIVKAKVNLNYKQALKDIRILTITAMIDLEKIPKRYCYMPDVIGEDIATWLKILKKGFTAYRQKEVLAYYRKTKGSRGSKKIDTALGRWHIYRKLENINVIPSIYYFVNYVISAIKKRMVRWYKIEKYNNKDLEVLISTQNLKDDMDVKKLLQKINIKSNYLIINQSKDCDITDKKVTTKNETGLSKSRNEALLLSSEKILIFADNDLHYNSEYMDTIIKYHNKYQDADIICFYVESANVKRKIKRMKTGKVGYVKVMRITSIEITMKRKAIIENGLQFNENFGAGAKYNRGEEQIFLYNSLRKGLKIIFVNKKIGEVEQRK